MKPARFIIIDNDPISNNICKLVLKSVYKEMEVRSFTMPDEGFEYLRSSAVADHDHLSVVLLDISMPGMTGWEFLDKYEYLDSKIQKKLRVFILSTAISSETRQKALSNKHVVDYILKPLTNNNITELVRKFEG